jgi:ubiquitin carboxyl-terminal hydrolase 5/13
MFFCLLLLNTLDGHLHLLGETGNFIPNEDAVSMIMTMGFTRVQSIQALKATDNNVERAADWIFSHQAELDSEDTDRAAVEPTFRDGEGRE